MQQRVFLSFLLGILWGIFLGNILFHVQCIIWGMLGISILFFLLLLRIKKEHILTVTIGVGILFWMVWSGWNVATIQEKERIIVEFDEKKVIVVAKIDNLYKKSDHYNSYILHTISIDTAPVSGIYGLVYYPKNLSLEKWDIVQFDTRIKKIDNFSEGFSYIRFAQTKNIYFSIFPHIGIRIDSEPVSLFIRSIDALRAKMLATIFSLYPKNEAVFLGGILIGAREDMSGILETNFARSGLTHLVAVSGFNITILIIFLGFLFRFLPMYIRLVSIVVVIFCFVVLVGIDNVPVVRAGIMGSIWYILLVFGRKPHTLTLLVFTATMLVLFEPLSLNYDSSFHPSFGAVLGLLYFQDFYSRIFSFLPKLFALRESFVLTMCAFTTTLPIMMMSFGQLQFFAPIANMLAGGAIPLAMLLGFLSILGEWMHPSIGFVIWFVEYFFLRYVTGIAEFFGSISWGVVELEFGIWGVYGQLLLLMMLGFAMIFLSEHKNDRKKR